jgi:type IV secretion system protein VirD4
MPGWTKSRPEPPKQATKPPKPAPESPSAVSGDVPDRFPRGLPDGNPRNPIATAQWGSSHDASRLLGEWKPGRFLVGRDAGGRYVGHADDRHILTVAGSRAGKGVSLIVPNLLTYPGSVIAIDPKGELATVTACRRSDTQGTKWASAMGGGGKVYVLDPFHRVAGPAAQFRSAFNPLADLDPDSDEGFDLAGQIADALVLQQEGPGSHWTMSARAFLRGLILYICKTQEPVTRNMVAIRRLLLQGPDELNAMLHDMATKHEGPIARAGNGLLAKPRDERGSVISTCDVQTDFLEGKPMQRVLTGSDFRLEDLKAGRVTVYLCLPATRLGTHGRWLRLMIGMTIEAMERTGLMKDGDHPVLFVLDEFAALGHMESIEKAAGQIAGFGVKLWPVVQDLTQLQRDYKDAWQTFMGNAGLLTFFGNTDLFTLEHVSKRLGECEAIRTVVNTSESWQRSDGTSKPGWLDALAGQGVGTKSSGDNIGGGRSANETLMKAQLMNPDEIARHFAREAGNVLALIPHPDYPPFALNRCAYYSAADDALFGGLFDPVPGKPDPLTSAAQRSARQHKRS